MRRTKEESELTRAAILNAAERVFCEQGFAGAFTERVLDALATRPGGSLLFLIGTRINRWRAVSRWRPVWRRCPGC